MKRFLGLLAVAFVLSGCGTIPASIDSILAGTPTFESTIKDEKALYAAEAAYNGAAQAVKLGLDSGAIKPGSPTALAIAKADARAYSALRAARSAYALGQPDEGRNKAGIVLGLVADIMLAIKGN